MWMSAWVRDYGLGPVRMNGLRIVHVVGRIRIFDVLRRGGDGGVNLRLGKVRF